MESTNSQKIFSQMPRPLSSALTSALTALPFSPKSETGQNQNGQNTMIGKQPLETASVGLQSLALINRDRPLTENQLTAITSQVLQQPLSIISEDKKAYGRKRFSDENGEYWLDNQVISTEPAIDCVVDINSSASATILQSALMISPREASIKHVTRLSMHKKFGTSQQEIAVKLVDYANALKDFPEFVVFEVCKFYWESDKRPFVPFIAEMKSACEVFHNALKGYVEKKELGKPVTKPDFYKSPTDNPVRRELCDYLLGQGEPDYFDQTRLWSNYDLEKRVDGWKNQKAKAEEALGNLSAG